MRPRHASSLHFPNEEIEVFEVPTCDQILGMLTMTYRESEQQKEITLNTWPE
jgi:hypothetical protein